MLLVSQFLSLPIDRRSKARRYIHVARSRPSYRHGGEIRAGGSIDDAAGRCSKRARRGRDPTVVPRGREYMQ